MKAMPSLSENATPENECFAGRLLLAMPGIGDPRFERAVVAVCLHDENGAPIPTPSAPMSLGLHQLLEQLEIEPGVAPDVPVLAGGPVEPQRGFVLHSQDWEGDGSLRVGDQWTLTATLDVLGAIAAGTGPAHYLVTLGYAGWGEGQLDAEMRQHGWFVAPGSSDIMFNTPVDRRWTGAFMKAGIDPRLLAATPGQA